MIEAALRSPLLVALVIGAALIGAVWLFVKHVGTYLERIAQALEDGNKLAEGPRAELEAIRADSAAAYDDVRARIRRLSEQAGRDVYRLEEAIAGLAPAAQWTDPATTQRGSATAMYPVVAPQEPSYDPNQQGMPAGEATTGFALRGIPGTEAPPFDPNDPAALWDYILQQTKAAGGAAAWPWTTNPMPLHGRVVTYYETIRASLGGRYGIETHADIHVQFPWLRNWATYVADVRDMRRDEQ